MTRGERLIELCRGRKAYIQTHNFPDPDALASGFGLSRFLERSGIQTVLCYDGQLDKRACRKMVELFHIEAVPLKELGEVDLTGVRICVDSQKDNGNVSPMPLKINIGIDHHPIFVPGEYDFEDIRKAGSCAALVANYYYEAGMEPDSNTASALLYGIKIDTHQLTRGVTDLDIDMFHFLNQFCNEQDLKKISGSVLAFGDLKAYYNAIENIRIYGDISFSEIDFSCSDDLIAMISDFFLSLDEIQISVVFCRREDGIKLSVRSSLEEVHAGVLVKLALEHVGTGGGHSYMAGGTIPADQTEKLGIYPEETIRDLFLKALKQIKEG